jgi:hypothetical protein
MEDLKLSLGFGIINSYKRLSYKQWYALAEYVDNSTQAYLNNQGTLDEIFKSENEILTVDISYTKNGQDEIIKIKDNSIGMSYEELKAAVIIGNPPAIRTGRSRYGLGMKTASFWLGDEWTVTTKKLNEDIEHSIVINIDDAVDNHGKITYSSKSQQSKSAHYTIVTITKLNQPFSSRTRGKIKEYLRSMYRYDIFNKILKLVWQGEELTWDYNEVFSKRVPMADGKDKIDFEFKIGEKNVIGWAGVIEDGSRTRAGFSVFQNKRVIMGWPRAYKPVSIFGDEGGRNDLINQRLVGELFLDDFTVSHTKDEIIFEGEDEDELEFQLKEEILSLLTLANKPKKNRGDTSLIDSDKDDEYNIALGSLEFELTSSQLADAFETFEIPDEEIITANNEVLISNVAVKSLPKIEVALGSLSVFVYLEDDISFNDPYLSIGVYSDINKLNILINKNHPHWNELNGSEAIMNFIRDCVYDGVSEWKAAKFLGHINPDTVKTIKDNLLRTSYRINNAS